MPPSLLDVYINQSAIGSKAVVAVEELVTQLRTKLSNLEAALKEESVGCQVGLGAPIETTAAKGDAQIRMEFLTGQLQPLLDSFLESLQDRLDDLDEVMRKVKVTAEAHVQAVNAGGTPQTLSPRQSPSALRSHLTPSPQPSQTASPTIFQLNAPPKKKVAFPAHIIEKDDMAQAAAVLKRKQRSKQLAPLKQVKLSWREGGTVFAETAPAVRQWLDARFSAQKLVLLGDRFSETDGGGGSDAFASIQSGTLLAGHEPTVGTGDTLVSAALAHRGSVDEEDLDGEGEELSPLGSYAGRQATLTDRGGTNSVHHERSHGFPQFAKKRWGHSTTQAIFKEIASNAFVESLSIQRPAKLGQPFSAAMDVGTFATLVTQLFKPLLLSVDHAGASSSSSAIQEGRSVNILSSLAKEIYRFLKPESRITTVLRVRWIAVALWHCSRANPDFFSHLRSEECIACLLASLAFELALQERGVNLNTSSSLAHDPTYLLFSTRESEEDSLWTARVSSFIFFALENKDPDFNLTGYLNSLRPPQLPQPGNGRGPESGQVAHVKPLYDFRRSIAGFLTAMLPTSYATIFVAVGSSKLSGSAEETIIARQHFMKSLAHLSILGWLSCLPNSSGLFEQLFFYYAVKTGHPCGLAAKLRAGELTGEGTLCIALSAVFLPLLDLTSDKFFSETTDEGGTNVEDTLTLSVEDDIGCLPLSWLTQLHANLHLAENLTLPSSITGDEGDSALNPERKSRRGRELNPFPIAELLFSLGDEEQLAIPIVNTDQLRDTRKIGRLGIPRTITSQCYYMMLRVWHAELIRIIHPKASFPHTRSVSKALDTFCQSWLSCLIVLQDRRGGGDVVASPTDQGEKGSDSWQSGREASGSFSQGGSGERVRPFVLHPTELTPLWRSAAELESYFFGPQFTPPIPTSEYLAPTVGNDSTVNSVPVASPEQAQQQQGTGGSAATYEARRSDWLKTMTHCVPPHPAKLSSYLLDPIVVVLTQTAVSTIEAAAAMQSSIGASTDDRTHHAMIEYSPGAGQGQAPSSAVGSILRRYEQFSQRLGKSQPAQEAWKKSKQHLFRSAF
jgi:hypothetical protein